ncbi:MAG TPA: beta-ketoacyl synthase N-terminal-like domain-containing protein [Candidatus Binatia bacterium]|nr:beta-ketoacyl synthase N-terminal-like domain-containing protein [Candidatus Binatia bacterium]
MIGSVVAGIGWITSRGPGRGREAREFSMTSGPIPPVAREDVFPEPNLRFGRLPQYSRVGLAAVAFALRDAGMEQWETKRFAGLVASTRAGCLATDIEYYDTVLPEGGGVPSPNLFSSTLPTCFLGEAAIQFGLTGPTLIVNDPAEDAMSGVRMTLESLAWGECGTMLAGHIDLPAGPAIPGIRPPWTGGLFMVLESAPDAAATGYGTLDLSDGGAVRHNGTGVADLNALVRACLAFRWPS